MFIEPRKREQIIASIRLARTREEILGELCALLGYEHSTIVGAAITAAYKLGQKK